MDSSERLGRYRWTVERTQAWLVAFRRLAIRYDRHAAPVLAFLHLACALAWASLVGSSLVLALLLNAALASGGAGQSQAAPTPALSPVTAALADGDDVRGRFLASARGQQLDLASAPSLSH